MTQSEKLKALVQKATDNGLVTPLFSWISEDYQALLDYWFTADNYKAIIFNHDFAKALLGDDTIYIADILESPTEGDAGWEERLDSWEYHLQQAVISPDPIDYLYKAAFKQ